MWGFPVPRFAKRKGAGLQNAKQVSSARPANRRAGNSLRHQNALGVGRSGVGTYYGTGKRVPDLECQCFILSVSFPAAAHG